MTTARRTVRDGIVVGLIGYVSVAAWYSVFDLLAARRTLYTVNLLGEAVFRGLRDPGVLQYPIHLDMPAIFLYNALHLVIALAVGLIVTRLVAQAGIRGRVCKPPPRARRRRMASAACPVSGRDGEPADTPGDDSRRANPVGC